MHRFLPALIRRQGEIIKVVEVNHRDRQFGKSKYNMLGRLGVGLIDMAGVYWLQKRNKLNDVILENGCSVDVTGYITMVYTYVDIGRK